MGALEALGLMMASDALEADPTRGSGMQPALLRPRSLRLQWQTTDDGFAPWLQRKALRCGIITRNA